MAEFRKKCLKIFMISIKIVSMIRKYHNHKLQTSPLQREEEPHNNHETLGRQTKQSNQLSSQNKLSFVKLSTLEHTLAK